MKTGANERKGLNTATVIRSLTKDPTGTMTSASRVRRVPLIVKAAVRFSPDFPSVTPGGR